MQVMDVIHTGIVLACFGSKEYVFGCSYILQNVGKQIFSLADC